MLAAALLTSLVLNDTVARPCPAVPPVVDVNMLLGVKRELPLPDWRGTIVPVQPFVQLTVDAAGALWLESRELGDAQVTVLLPEGSLVMAVHVRRWTNDPPLCPECAVFPCGAKLTFKLVGERVFLVGEPGSPEELRLARQLARTTDRVVVLARLPAPMRARLVSDIDLALWRAGLGEAHVVVAGTMAWLEGYAADPQRRARAEALAGPMVASLLDLLP